MQTADAEKLWSLIRSAKFAMLVTEDDGHLRARPMAVAQQGFDGTLWFFTHASGHMVTEAASRSGVCVTFADTHSQDYVSFSGHATLVQDADEINRRWSPLLKAWFPDGRNDPDMALLKIAVDQAEYWDNPNSRIVRIYGYVKAAVTGSPPHMSDGKKVQVS